MRDLKEMQKELFIWSIRVAIRTSTYLWTIVAALNQLPVTEQRILNILKILGKFFVKYKSIIIVRDDLNYTAANNVSVLRVQLTEI